jgi:6-phosphofructokinase 1
MATPGLLTARRHLGVLTSGGDAQGMNAAVRAVVRRAIGSGVRVFAVREGYEGLVEGGDRIAELHWGDVGGIMHRGGTVIGTARSERFRTREGRLQAARHLVERDIDRLVVIGGDGSLTGANTFREEWPGLLAELVERRELAAESAARHATLSLVGLVGSIDNDLVGIDMTIGADSALHRITDAIDALASTAASHQRAFVVEVMGRHCGYLGVMGAVAGGADWVLAPEDPPEPGWEDSLCELVRAGRRAGRRDCLVVVAEGAIDSRGQPITSACVKRVLEEQLREEVRVTILGHVQRGGVPSAFDRWMSTIIGCAAVDELLAAGPGSEPHVIGLRYNRVSRVPLVEAVAETRRVAGLIADRKFDQAMKLRGGSFTEMVQIFRVLAAALPTVRKPAFRHRLAIMHAGGPAPGMNTAVRAAARLGLDLGHTVLAVRNGVDGLVAGRIEELHWGSVEGWNARGGAELGTSRRIPAVPDLPVIAAQLEEHRVGALLMIGGWAGYEGVRILQEHRQRHPALDVPMVCVPATIDNDAPGSELSIGADTALNVIVEALDRIKQSAVAVHRCFVVEVMGRYCGYLALMSGMAGGAERVYLHERGVTLDDLRRDVRSMKQGFREGKRLSLVVRNEYASRVYTTDFISSLFEGEGEGLFDVRRVVLGHLQQGADPMAFDRVQATRLAAHAIWALTAKLATGARDATCIGIRGGQVENSDLDAMLAAADPVYRRPREQWWLPLESIVEQMSHPHADVDA